MRGSAPDPAPPPRPAASPWLALLAVGLGQFMVVMDVTILNIALPTIGRELAASLPSLQWAIVSYSVTMIALVPTLGRLSDVLGRKRLYVTGVVLFGGASALAGLSVGIGTLIAARVLQAVGGALITSNTLAILTDVFPPGRRGVAMGIQSILISGGAALGPVLGGFLVTAFGWEAVFYVNVPVSVLAAALALRVLPARPPAAVRPPIDWPGAGLLLVALVGLLTAISRAPQWGAASPAVLAAGGVGAAFLVAFVARQRRAAHPLVAPALLRVRALVAGLVAGLFGTMSLVSMVFVLPFYWQALRGLSAQQAGLYMLPVPLGIGLVAPIAGRLSDRVGSRGLTVGALCVVAAAAALVSRVDASASVPDVLWRVALLGLGLGAFLAPNNNGIMSAAPAADRGVTAGLLALSRFVGQSLGIVAAGTVLAHALPTASLETLLDAGLGLEGDPPADLADALAPEALADARARFLEGFRGVTRLVIPLALTGALASALRGRTARERA